MPDNWGFVIAAYAVTALVLGAYWRRLTRLERNFAARIEMINRSRSTQPNAPRAGHPRAEPASRPPLP